MALLADRRIVMQTPDIKTRPIKALAAQTSPELLAAISPENWHAMSELPPAPNTWAAIRRWLEKPRFEGKPEARVWKDFLQRLACHLAYDEYVTILTGLYESKNWGPESQVGALQALALYLLNADPEPVLANQQAALLRLLKLYKHLHRCGLEDSLKGIVVARAIQAQVTSYFCQAGSAQPANN